METALLIFAIAFAVLVVFLCLFIFKLSKVVEETQQTIKVLTSDVAVTLHHTNEILAKADVLVDDVNGKMTIVEPLFVAVADLSTSVSALNASARDLGTKASKATKSTVKTGAAVSTLNFVSKFFKK